MNTIDQYQLQDRLGSGGFATVWLGYDPGFDGHVAIKVLGDNWVGQPDVVRRFLDEARLLWRAENDRVVDVFTIGELATGQPWFAMEHADRGTLADRLAEGPLATLDAIGLIAEMGRCIEAVHRLGAVHRDVKPGNFLIRSLSQGVTRPVPGLASDERLMIGDLGFAKVLASSSGFTVAGGSPLYMPPEQASTSAEVSFTSDVFSLGICAWEVLTGAPPKERGAYAAVAQFDVEALPALSTFRPDITAEIEAVILRAMQPAPSDRWQTAQEFVDELVQASQATPPMAVMEPKPTKRRGKTMTALMASAAIAALAVVGVVLVLGRGPGLGDTPDWFVLPPAVDQDGVQVTAEANKTSVIGVLPSGFQAACETFVVDALSNDYGVVRDDCTSPDAVASMQHSGGATAVMAQLADGRVGWQFIAE